MTDLLTQFADWVQTKPRNATYNWGDINNCAFAQFDRATGIYTGPRGCEAVAGCNFPVLPFGAIDPLVTMPWTFGALAERLARYTTMAQTIKDCKPILVPSEEERSEIYERLLGVPASPSGSRPTGPAPQAGLSGFAASILNATNHEGE